MALIVDRLSTHPRDLPSLWAQRKSGLYTRPTVELRGLLALQSAGILPDGELLPGDGSSQDTRLGFDWTLLEHDGAGSGVAVHVGWNGDKGTFSLRSHTTSGEQSELIKRRVSLERGGNVPTYTVHLYAHKGTGVIEQAYLTTTAQLYRHVLPRCPTEAAPYSTMDLCSCSTTDRNPDGSRAVYVAVTEEARTRMGVRSALPGSGIKVRALWPHKANMAAGLWG